MASQLYPFGKQALLTAQVNMISDVIRAALIDTGTYTFNTAHQFFSSASGVVGTPTQLAGVTVNSPNPGVIDAADLTFLAVSGASIEALIIYKDTGNPATAPLIAFIDGMTVVPQGGDIQIVWDNGPFRIFSL